MQRSWPLGQARAEGEGKMKRLQKFVERGASGEAAGRHAYVLESSALPMPSADTGLFRPLVA